MNDAHYKITKSGKVYLAFLEAAKALSANDKKQVIFRHDPPCGPEIICSMCHEYFDWSGDVDRG